jgi:hypothetical protein
MSAIHRISVLILLLVLAAGGNTVTVGAEPAKVAGKWNAVLELEAITGHPVLTFKQDGEKLSGTYQGRYGESPLEGTIKENKIEFAVTINAEGTQSQGVFAGTVDGDFMKGRVAFEGGGEGTWSAERVKQ